MEKHWVRGRGNRKLLVFTLGWAADPKIVKHIAPPGCDYLYISDYREFTPLTDIERTQITAYPERFLFAWSFGVMAAEQLFAGMEFTHSVAFNGTPYPIDSRFGIDPRVFATTLRGLPKHGIDEFNKRVYGDDYDRFKDVLSPRNLQENTAELIALQGLAESSMSSLNWHKAVIGTCDAIFPPANMAAYWQDRAELLPLPHYPFADANIILREIDNR